MENIRVLISMPDGYYEEFLESITCNETINWKSFSASLSKVQKDVNRELTELIDKHNVSPNEETSAEELSDEDDDYKRKLNSGDMKLRKKVRSK